MCVNVSIFTVCTVCVCMCVCVNVVWRSPALGSDIVSLRRVSGSGLSFALSLPSRSSSLAYAGESVELRASAE